jgi:elongation factor Ts
MAEITSDLVKRLREMTGAGMMDCKKALGETGGNVDEAVDYLRKKGIAKAGSKAGRVAAQGLVTVAVDNGKGAVVEVNSETDFVARNEKFQDFVKGISQLALKSGSVEELAKKPFPGSSGSVADKLTDLIATIGENMSLRRMAAVSANPGVVAAYVHSALLPNMGKIGVLVALESSGDQGKLAAVGKQLAMHIAFANPQAVTSDAVPAAAIEREKAVLAETAKASGKPEPVIAKMIEGGLRKYFEDIVLLEQTFAIDGKSKVKDVMAAAAKDVGAPVKVTGFVRMALGEGVEAPAEA